MRRATKKTIHSRRKINAPAVDRPLFSAEEKLIYRFKECGKLRAVDPIRVASELAASDPSLDFLLKTMTLPTPDAGKNAVQAAGIIRKAFGCAEQREDNGQIVGMMDGDCLALFNDFALWVEDIKKKFGIQDLPQFAMQSEVDGSVASSPTPTTPESTSARTDFSFGDPSQSPSPSQSVLEKPQPGFTMP